VGTADAGNAAVHSRVSGHYSAKIDDSRYFVATDEYMAFAQISLSEKRVFDSEGTHLVKEFN
jgi:hypothetical protein